MATKIDIDDWMRLRQQAKREMVGVTTGMRKVMRSSTGHKFTAVMRADGEVDLPDFIITGHQNGGRVCIP